MKLKFITCLVYIYLFDSNVNEYNYISPNENSMCFLFAFIHNSQKVLIIYILN